MRACSAILVLVGLPMGCGPLNTVHEEPLLEDDYYAPQRIVYEDRTYDPQVRAVQLFPRGVELAPPIIALNTDDVLELHFDDLLSIGAATAPEARTLSYTIVHCDAHWVPTGIAHNVAVEGAMADYLPPPRQSFGVRQPYLHYQLTIPNAMMRPRISGNYILLAYGDDPGDPLLTRRFMVAEQQIQIDASVRASRNVELRDVQQQVDLTLHHPGFPIADPFGDLEVVVLQNMRWDDARHGLRPRFVRDTELIYDHPAEALFNGGNEWRQLRAWSTRYQNIGVQRISADGPLVEFFLAPDARRTISMYVDAPDRNGKWSPRTDDGRDPNLEADHVWVNWQLPLDAPITGGEVYVYGEVTDMQCKREFRCTWDPQGRRYVLRAFIKQGAIDHCFAFLPDSSDVPDLGRAEGSHYQTENDYLILVYFNDVRLRAHRLVGVRLLNSRRG